MWLNLYGHQAVRRKLKKGLKMHFCVFSPLHQIILLTQGTIPEIFVKKYCELVELKNSIF
jgi:hypothetical protein